MKAFYKILYRLCTLLFCALLLGGCQKKEQEEQVSGTPFLAGLDLLSGHYYFVYDDEYSGRDGLLFDDPQILHQYQDRIVTTESNLKKFMFGEGGGGQFSLWDKRSGQRIRSNSRTQNVHLPAAMRRLGKVISRNEHFGSEDAFLQRLFTLRTLKDVALSFSHKSEREIFKFKDGMPYGELRVNKRQQNCQWHTPAENTHEPYRRICDGHFVQYRPGKTASEERQYVTSIIFPAVITKVDEAYDSAAALGSLRQRISDLLAQRQIESYYLVGAGYDFVQGFYASPNRPPALVLHEHYRLEDSFLRYPDYKAYAFGLRIFCNRACHEALQDIAVMDWLPSPVPHEKFLEDLAIFLRSHNKELTPEIALSAGDYRMYSLFEDRMLHEPEAEDSALRWQQGWLGHAHIPPAEPSAKERWRISWEYSLQRAVNEPYPARLLPTAGKGKND